MRIITGIAKGRIIKAPEGLDTRPTADRVKQSLFNIINNKVLGSRVLDLFAGTGNLGLEAISQGAIECTFIEHNKKTFSILADNIKLLGFENKIEKFQGDAIENLKMLSKKGKEYDLILLDPPYGKGLIETAIEQIDKLQLLSNDGIIVSEYDSNDIMPEKIGTLLIYRTVKYGRTKISFWNRGEQ
jgi:16S rRNA (guanine966-N2)-methyltransferase